MEMEEKERIKGGRKGEEKVTKDNGYNGDGKYERGQRKENMRQRIWRGKGNGEGVR